MIRIALAFSVLLISSISFGENICPTFKGKFECPDKYASTTIMQVNVSPVPNGYYYDFSFTWPSGRKIDSAQYYTDGIARRIHRATYQGTCIDGVISHSTSAMTEQYERIYVNAEGNTVFEKTIVFGGHSESSVHICKPYGSLNAR